MGDLIIPMKSEVLAVVRDELCLPDRFYITNAEIYLHGDKTKYPLGIAEFSVQNSGHWKFDPGTVHAQDSLGCAAQLAYALFIQCSLEGFVPQIPRLPMVRLTELLRDKSGGAYLAASRESRYKGLPKEFRGTLEINGIHGGNGRPGCTIETTARLGESPRNHYMELEFGVMFPN